VRASPFAAREALTSSVLPRFRERLQTLSVNACTPARRTCYDWSFASMLGERLLDAGTIQQVLPAPLVHFPPARRKPHDLVDQLGPHDEHSIEVGEEDVARVDGRRREGRLERRCGGGLRVDLEGDLDAGRASEGRLADDRVPSSKDLRAGEDRQEEDARHGEEEVERTGKLRSRSSVRSRHRPDVTTPRTPFLCKAVASRPPRVALLVSVRTAGEGQRGRNLRLRAREKLTSRCRDEEDAVWFCEIDLCEV